MRRFLLGLATCAVASAWPALASADNKVFSQQVANTLRDSGQLYDYNIGGEQQERRCRAQGARRQ